MAWRPFLWGSTWLRMHSTPAIRCVSVLDPRRQKCLTYPQNRYVMAEPPRTHFLTRLCVPYASYVLIVYLLRAAIAVAAVRLLSDVEFVSKTRWRIFRVFDPNYEICLARQHGAEIRSTSCNRTADTLLNFLGSGTYTSIQI